MYDLSIVQDYYDHSCASGGLVEAVLDGLFDEERDAILDPSEVKAYQCTRRAGKTHTQAADAFICSETHPDGESMCISITRGSCRATIGNALERLRREYDLPLSEHQRDGLLYWLNERTNHKIWLRGCKDFNEAEKIRGDYLYGAWVDEAQSFPLDVNPANDKVLLHYLVEDVLSPRLLDKNGKLVLSGTPGPLLNGYFWEVTTGAGSRPKWPSVHRWSMMDNPFLADAEAWVQKRKELFGWTESSPGYQREILGQWVFDPESLIYQYNAQRNGVNWGPWPGCLDKAMAELGDDLFWGLGVDLGHHDATAFVLAVQARGRPHKYLLRAWGGSELTQPQRAAEMHRVREALKDRGQRLGALVMDTGGGGAMVAHDMSTVYGVPVEAAKKQEKAAGIRVVQGDLIRGHLVLNVGECGQLIGEWSVLPWNELHTNHADDFPDHWSDATLYVLRRMLTSEAWAKEQPKPGSAEAVAIAQAQHKSMAARISSVRMQLSRARTLTERASLQAQLNQLMRRGMH